MKKNFAWIKIELQRHSAMMSKWYREKVEKVTLEKSVPLLFYLSPSTWKASEKRTCVPLKSFAG